MTDQEIIQGLIARDERITKDFFFSRCKPLIYHMIEFYFPNETDYDGYIGELYVHLMEKDAKRLRQFNGQSSLFTWLQIVIGNFFLDKIKRAKRIDFESEDRLLDKSKNELTDNSANEAIMDIAAILDHIDNESYRFIIQKHIIEGVDFDELEKITGKSRANLYNIKTRALKALKKVAKIARTRGDKLCVVYCERFVLQCFGIHKKVKELKDFAISQGWLLDDGALIENIGNIAKAEGLKVEKIDGASLQDIKDALANGKQVIAAVDGGELIGDPVEERVEDVFAGEIVDHCVAVLSVNEEANQVALYDPAFGPIPLTVTVPHFLDAWEDSKFHCVVFSK